MIKKRKPTKSKVASKVSTQTKVSLVVAMVLAAFIGYSFALSMVGSFDKMNNNQIMEGGPTPCNPACTSNQICITIHGSNGVNSSQCVDFMILVDALVKSDSLGVIR